MEVGSITATIRATAEAFKATMNGVKKEIQDLAKQTQEQAKKASDAAKQIAQGSKNVADGAREVQAELTKVAVASAAAFYGMIKGIQDVINSTNQFNNAIIGLQSTAASLNINLNDVTEAAKELSKDGLMSIGEAATGLKNLLLAGFGLDQAIILMQRFKDSAAFGRQGALSFGEAIVSATEGIKNGNSILVDNAGVTKNLSVMLEEAGYSAQDLSRATSDAGVRQAIFNGILKETQHQLGDAAKLANSLSGQMSAFEVQVNYAKTAVGNALAPAMENLYSVMSLVLQGFTNLANAHPQLVAGIITVTTSLTGLVALFTSLNLIIPQVKKAIELLNVTLLKSPWGWVALAIGAVVAAIYNYIAATQRAKKEQELFNQKVEQLNKIKVEGIQDNQVEEIKQEAQQLEDLIRRYDELKAKLEEAKNTFRESPGVAAGYDTTIAITQAQIGELDKKLRQLGYTYETATEAIKIYNKALEEQAKIQQYTNNDAIKSEIEKYTAIQNTNQKIIESAQQYINLAQKQNLSAQEASQLANTMQYLIDIFGQDIAVRGKDGELIGISIEALKKEVEQVKNSSEEHKKAIEAKIRQRKLDIQSELDRANAILKSLKIEQQAYLEQQKILAKVLKNPLVPFGGLIGSVLEQDWATPYEIQIQGQQRYINELQNSIAELDRLRTQLYTSSIATSAAKINTKASKAQEVYRNEALENALDVYNYRKHLNQLTIDDEIKMLETIKAKYAKTADEIRQLDTMIYDARQEKMRQSFEFSKNWIDQEKYYNRMSLEEELAAWERVRDRYAKNSEFYKEADREVYRVRKEMLDNSVEAVKNAADKMYNAQIEALQKEYDALQEAYNDRIDLINREKNEKIDALREAQQEALDSLDREQREYEKNYKARLKMIDDEANAKIKALQDQIDAINRAAEEQDRQEQLADLQRLYELYSKSTTAEGQEKAKELAKQIRDIQNEQLTQSLQDQIDNIKENAEIQKDQLQQEYELMQERFAEEKDAIKAHYDELIKEAQAYYDDLLERTKKAYEEEKQKLDERKFIIEQTHEQILASAQQFAQQNLEVYKQNQDDIISMLQSKAGVYYQSAQALGQAFARGLEEQAQRVKEAATKLAQAASDVLELHSPAKEGPLSRLHTWWKAFTPTLLAGLDIRPIKDIIMNVQGARPAFAGAPRPIIVTLNDYGQKIFKDKLDIENYQREQAKILRNTLEVG
ncbi:hypothetical protein [Thermoanaerobacterium sp. DL9XJH110]|uniref:hypothetical protein n=1 Tax=Thermoanaerobacterium sp. DL9XJH110 TaxID=3386643 RepID=UPI003BB78533